MHLGMLCVESEGRVGVLQLAYIELLDWSMSAIEKSDG